MENKFSSPQEVLNKLGLVKEGTVKSVNPLKGTCLITTTDGESLLVQNFDIVLKEGESVKYVKNEKGGAILVQEKSTSTLNENILQNMVAGLEKVQSTAKTAIVENNEDPEVIMQNLEKKLVEKFAEYPVVQQRMEKIIKIIKEGDFRTPELLQKLFANISIENNAIKIKDTSYEISSDLPELTAEEGSEEAMKQGKTLPSSKNFLDSLKAITEGSNGGNHIEMNRWCEGGQILGVLLGGPVLEEYGETASMLTNTPNTILSYDFAEGGVSEINPEYNDPHRVIFLANKG